MAEQHDQHRDYRSGKYTGFNKEWYDKLRASKPNWKKVSEARVHPNRGIPVHVKAGQVFRSIIPDGSNIIDVMRSSNSCVARFMSTPYKVSVVEGYNETFRSSSRFRGNTTVKVVPSPSVLSTRIEPRWSWMIW